VAISRSGEIEICILGTPHDTIGRKGTKLIIAALNNNTHDRGGRTHVTIKQQHTLGAIKVGRILYNSGKWAIASSKEGAVFGKDAS
jgi:hypothetical protein